MTSHNPDPDAEFFSTEATAHASDGPLPTLKTWFARGDIALLKDETPGRGRERRFSLRRVMQIALVVRLARAGASPSAASIAAAKWTDVGRPDRLPGGLFPKGQSYFVARIDRDGSVPRAEVTNSDSLLQAFAHAQADTICAVHLNQLDIDVRKRLGIIA